MAKTTKAMHETVVLKLTGDEFTADRMKQLIPDLERVIKGEAVAAKKGGGGTLHAKVTVKKNADGSSETTVEVDTTGHVD